MYQDNIVTAIEVKHVLLIVSQIAENIFVEKLLPGHLEVFPLKILSKSFNLKKNSIVLEFCIKMKD